MANYIRNLAPDMSQVLVPAVLEPFLPRIVRPFNHEWAAAPFPSAVEGLENVTVCDMDVLCIPQGARHPREAFEFIAYVQRQEVLEKLCRLQCKHSPLATESDQWVYTHPNPYVHVFDDLAASPNANHCAISPLWQAAASALHSAVEQHYLLVTDYENSLARSQQRIDGLMRDYRKQEALRRGSAP